MDGEYNIFSAHLVVGSLKNIEELAEIKSRVREILKTFDIEHATLEFETEQEPCDLEHC